MADKKWSSVTRDVVLADINTANAKVLLYDPAGVTDADKNPTMSVSEIEPQIGIAQAIDPYSTTEVKTNKYSPNGRPIYRKVIEFGTLPNATSKSVSAGIATNLQQIFRLEAVANNASTAPGTAYPVPRGYNGTPAMDLIYTGSDQVRITTFENPGSFPEVDIIIEYTKSTDSAGAIPTSLWDINSAGYIDKYDTSEVKTNKFHSNGKPVYRKRVSFGALPNTTIKQVAHNISNLDLITEVSGMSTNGSARLPIPFVNVGALTEGVEIILGGVNITIECGIDRSTYTETYIDIEYTKTTDSTGTIPDSTSTYQTYKTTEQAIGEWHDGRTLYRKVIAFGTLPNSTSKLVSAGISTNLHQITRLEGVANNDASTPTTVYPLPRVLNSLNSMIDIIYTGTDEIRITTYEDPGAFPTTDIIIEYTKD